jgi:mono/diheme cytochrome c family protein
MKHVIAKWMMKAGLATLVFAALSAVHPAVAQSQPGMRINVPYAFTFTTKEMPAGTYIFTLNKTKLFMESVSGARIGSNVVTTMNGPAVIVRDGSLVFDKTGSHILSEVWFPGSTGVLLHSIPKGHERAVLLGSSLSTTGTVSGIEAFQLTCAKCHGEDGKGSKEANKFFNVAVPNLTLAQVQSMSDAELRNKISQGSAKMPPVEIDEAGFRHLLPPQDVDAVIAYVRTLKQ